MHTESHWSRETAEGVKEGVTRSFFPCLNLGRAGIHHRIKPVSHQTQESVANAISLSHCLTWLHVGWRAHAKAPQGAGGVTLCEFVSIWYLCSFRRSTCFRLSQAHVSFNLSVCSSFNPWVFLWIEVVCHVCLGVCVCVCRQTSSPQGGFQADLATLECVTSSFPASSCRPTEHHTSAHPSH